MGKKYKVCRLAKYRSRKAGKLFFTSAPDKGRHHNPVKRKNNQAMPVCYWVAVR